MLRLDDLQFKNLKLYQDSDNYCFTSDSVLLANYAKCKPNDKVVEFCAGSGVVSILFSKKQRPGKITAFEMQKQLYELFVKSIEYNKLSDTITAINCKNEQAVKMLGAGYADVIMCNPPYFVSSEAIENPTSNQIATIELYENLDGLLKTAARLLKFGGKFYMVHRVDRLVDIFYSLRQNKLEPKNLTIIYPKKDAVPVVCLVTCIKGGKPDLKVSKVVYADQINKSTDSFDLNKSTD